MSSHSRSETAAKHPTGHSPRIHPAPGTGGRLETAALFQSREPLLTHPAPSIPALQQLLFVNASIRFHAAASMHLEASTADTTTPLTATLPLPAGFSLAATSVILFALPAGFHFDSGAGRQIQISAQPPFATDSCSQPSLSGPILGPIDGVPAGAMLVWTMRNDDHTNRLATVRFAIQSVRTSRQTGLSGDFFVWISGLNGTQCRFKAPGVPILPPQPQTPGQE